MYDLEESIMERHSTRMFLPRPVPRALVDEALALAQHRRRTRTSSRGGWCSPLGRPGTA